MSMNSTAIIPISTPGRKWVGWWIVPVIGFVALAAAAIKFKPWLRTETAIGEGQFYTVLPMDLEVKVNKDGELQAVSYIDIKSEVETQTQIITLIPEGSTVRKGDVLVKLDSSQLSTKKESLDLDLRNAESALKIAREIKEIQESQNAANQEAAEVALRLAQIELLQFTEGTYPQALKNAQATLSMADLTFKQKEDNLRQTQSLHDKGFVTETDLKKSQLELATATNDKEKAATALMVLEKYTKEMDLARLKSAEAQAQQKLIRTLRENANTLNQKIIDYEGKLHALNLLKKNAAKLQVQLDACTITAPEGGLVLYASSIDRNMKEQVLEGASVRQSQWLIRLPDVRQMKAVLRIQEAQKPKLDENKKQRASVKILGIPQPVGATLHRVSVLPDNSQRWWNPDLREYPVELLLDETPPGLKPGVRVENAEIFISRVDQVLAVPFACLYTTGRDSYVFVRTEEGLAKERKVKIGTANETHVQVIDGLSSGDQILLLQAGQGRLLLEKAGIKVSDPATRPSRGGGGGGTGGGGKGRGGPQGPPSQQEQRKPGEQPNTKMETRAAVGK
jgi:HlyD family secretion protein